MSRFTGLSFRTLHERLGVPDQKRVVWGGFQLQGFQLFWYCNPEYSSCIARIDAAGTPVPSGLSAHEQEFFEHAPFPKDGWTLNACAKHRDAFDDYPEEQ